MLDALELEMGNSMFASKVQETVSYGTLDRRQRSWKMMLSFDPLVSLMSHLDLCYPSHLHYLRSLAQPSPTASSSLQS